MLEQQDIRSLIASDKKELSQFVLDLCGFTLDEAGYDSKAYAFYLHVAFRHQAILQSEEWDAICKAITEAYSSGKPLNWSQENQELHQRIVAFAQSIVTEVTEASQDNMAIKLIKTSYLSNLDRARVSTELAIRHLAAQPGQNPSDVNASMLSSTEDATQEFIDLLMAQRAYLDSLLGLPFVMEKLCIRLARNQPGTNYQPRKTAEMLAKTLKTIDDALHANEAEREGKLVMGLQLALAVTMPDVQFADHELVDMISDEFLPFVNKIIENTHNLESIKKQVLPKNEDGADHEIAVARKQILAAMDIQFDSVQDILIKTMLEPVNQGNQAVASAVGLGLATVRALLTDNHIDHLDNIGIAFENFDKIAAVCAQIDPSLLPSWLSQANGYYQQVRAGATVVEGVTQTALRGLGAFYDYAVSLIPTALRHYLSRTDELTRVLNQVDQQRNNFQLDKIMAYFAFYDLVKTGGITDINLKAKLFDTYMSEVVKADSKLKPEEFLFDNYLLLERQLKDKFNLQQSLVMGIEYYGLQTGVPTRSLIFAADALSISSPLKLDILILVNRLQTLESKFDPKKPEKAFSELAEASVAAAAHESEALKNFQKEFLLPAMQRMRSEYQTKRLIPWLENLLQKTTDETHTLRRVYSKLRENINLSPGEVAIIHRYIETYSEFAPHERDELASFGKLTASLPLDKKKLENSKWLTPSEKSAHDAAHTLDTIVPGVQLLLDVLQERLDEQLNSCRELNALSNNPRIKQLAEKKLQYIAALNGLINKLREGLTKPHSELQGYILQLLQGDLAAMIAEPLEQLSAGSVQGKLLDLAWNVWPVASDTKQSSTNTLAYRLLAYYLKNTPLEAVVQAENEYRTELNRNPVPALMKDLNDPLAPLNIIPSQEKIMDAIIANLVESGKKSAFSWGVNYVKQVVATISKDQLVKFLPYPFLAELALQAIQSEAVQARIAPIVNSLMNEYGGVVSDKIDEFTKIAKARLYPVLGIELQKTIELGAYHYLRNPDTANSTDRDSFAMYYLQYREMKLNTPHFNVQAAIEFLFSELLADHEAEQQGEILANIVSAFRELDNKLTDAELPKSDAIAETEHQLQFLIDHVDLSDSANDTLIKLALVNRLLVMAMDTAEQLGDVEQVTRLQEQAISKLSDTLEKIDDLSKGEQQDVRLPGSALDGSKMAQPAEMAEAISGANKRAAKLQLSQVKTRLQKARGIVDVQVSKHQAMLGSKEPLLGLSILEWEYHKSPASRKIVAVFSTLVKILGPVFTWVSIIGAILASKGILEVLAISAGLGSTVTGIGLAIFVGMAVLSLTWNFAMKIVQNLAEFKKISQEDTPFFERAGKITLLTLKCLGLALAKSLFIDYIAVKITTLLAFGPFATLRNAIRFWPPRDRVGEELNKLQRLQSKLAELETLIEKQINHIEKKIDSDTQEIFTDQSEAIAKLTGELDDELETFSTFMENLSANDARFAIESYQEVLNAYQNNFVDLKKEFAGLERLLAAQAAVKESQAVEAIKPEQAVEEAVVPAQETKAAKAVVVNLEAYKVKLKIGQPSLQEKSDVTQQGFLSRMWNYCGRSPKNTVEQKPAELSTGKAASSQVTNSSRETTKSEPNIQLESGAKSALEQHTKPLSEMGPSLVEISIVESSLVTISDTHAANRGPWRKNQVAPSSRGVTLFGHRGEHLVVTPTKQESGHREGINQSY